MELSVNFLTGMVIGIVLFGMGLVVIARILDLGEELPDQVPSKIENEAQKCVSSGEKVCIPINTLTIRRGDRDIIYIVINNILTDEHTFETDIRFSLALVDDSEIHPGDAEAPTTREWMVDPIDLTLDRSENDIHSIAVEVPLGTAEGTYAFNAHVCYDDGNAATSDSECTGTKDLFGVPLQFRIKVP